MYNVFKRPMFKLGGEADQGTGIMSTVEPKQTMRQNPYTGYAIGGRIGYANGPGPVKFQDSPFYKPGMSVMESRGAFDEYIRDRNKKLFEEDPVYQKYMESISRPKPISDRENILKILRDQGAFSNVVGRPTFVMEEAAIKKFKEGDVEKTSKSFEAQRLDEERAAFGRVPSGGPGENPPNLNTNLRPRTYQKPTQLSLKEQVEKESQEIRDLIPREMTGEAALILSQVFADPKADTFAKKIQLAAKLAQPLAAKIKQEDRDITLAAYKLAKEKEQQQIKADAPTGGFKDLKAKAAAIARREGRDEGEVVDELLAKSGERAIKDQEKDLRLKILGDNSQKIFSTVEEIKEKRREKQRLLSEKKDTKQIDQQLADLEDQFKVFKDVPEFESAFPQFKNFKKGGRVMKQDGGDLDVEEAEETKATDMIASKVSFDNKPQDATVVEKPVEKLSYKQLRDRLPQEITNDVVMLIANSEEALQDFAYIRTQSDVNNFNIKYAVNLIIPPTAG